jgi:hypothetical protein
MIMNKCWSDPLNEMKTLNISVNYSGFIITVQEMEVRLALEVGQLSNIPNEMVNHENSSYKVLILIINFTGKLE